MFYILVILVVKTCHVFVGQNADKHKARWEREIELMTNKIRHLNIVRGLNVKPDSFRHELLKSNPSGALITEFCTGGDLRRQLNDNRHACGMPESMVRNIAQALTNATFYLHSMSIIHRDIKPENIVSHVTTDGRRIYKVIQWNYYSILHFIDNSTIKMLMPLFVVDRFGLCKTR